MDPLYEINDMFRRVLSTFNIDVDSPEMEDKLDDAVHAFATKFGIE